MEVVRPKLAVVECEVCLLLTIARAGSAECHRCRALLDLGESPDGIRDVLRWRLMGEWWDDG
tara:strand:- start:61 stop:246 length:186 start_codon:yes stop_codon:yes gene_type:complete